MSRLDLDVIAKATGGVVVKAADSILLPEQEQLLKKAGYDKLQRKNMSDHVRFSFKNRNITLFFSSNHVGELLWTTHLLLNPIDIFSEHQKRLSLNEEIALADLKDIKASAAKLDAALEEHFKNYKVK